MSTEKPTPPKQKEAKKDPQISEKTTAAENADTEEKTPQKKQPKEKEIGGFEDSGLKEPTRFGDWEVNGRCSDF